MQPSSRQELIEYCLRNLGHPVIQINIDPSQVEDRIDDAIQYYLDFHYDAAEKKFFVYTISDDDVSNGYIELPENFYAISRIVPALSTLNAHGDGLFDVRYQMHMQDFYAGGSLYTGGNLQYWETTKQHMELLRQMFNPEKSFEFNRKTNRIYLHQNIGKVKKETPRLIIEAYSSLDPDEFPKLYNDWWLKRYATALIGRAWGSNVRKYQNFQLPGGITLNGAAIYDEFNGEVAVLERELQQNLQLPCNFYVG